MEAPVDCEQQQVSISQKQRLEELKAAAEAQMRRPAPPIGGSAPKRRRKAAESTAAGGGAGARERAGEQEDEGDEEEEEEEQEEGQEEGRARVARYLYAGAEALVHGGAPCLLLTCGLRRQLSATKEGVELIKRKLPAGATASLVKVGCKGMVVVLVQALSADAAGPLPRAGGAEEGQAHEWAGSDQQQQQQARDGDPEQQDHKGQQEEAVGAAPQDQAGEEGQGQQQERQADGDGGSNSGGGGGNSGSGPGEPLDVAGLAAAILADVESGAAPRTRFVQRVIPGQATCLLEAPALRKAAASVCRGCVARLGMPPDGEPLAFAVAFKNRGFDGAPAPPVRQPEQQQQQQQQQQEGSGLVGAGLGAAAMGAAAGGADAPHAGGGAKGGDAGGEGPLLQRQAVITLLAEAMQEATGGRAKVDLKRPRVTLLAEALPVSVAGRRQVVVALSAVETSALVAVRAKGIVVRNVCRQNG